MTDTTTPATWTDPRTGRQYPLDRPFTDADGHEWLHTNWLAYDGNEFDALTRTNQPDWPPHRDRAITQVIDEFGPLTQAPVAANTNSEA